ncbi:MAG: glycosyltransferase [Caldilinea sp.]
MAASTSLDSKDQRRRLLFVAGRELTYTRNDVLVRALRRNGWRVDVIGSHESVRSISRATASLLPALAGKLLSQRYDLVVVGFYGYLLLPVVRMLTRKPILFDAFVSNYDTLCFDRQVVKPASLSGKAIYHFDRLICRWANHLLLDTPQHAAYFVDTFNLAAARVSSVPVGCNEEIFYKRPAVPRRDKTIVLHYSTFLPLHGVDVILQAADRLRSVPVHFRLIGDGPLHAAMLALAETLKLTNVEFLPPVPLANLAEEIASAQICLGGHFGSSDKSQRVVPGKIYQMMAMQRAIIAADSPANRALLRHGASALLSPAGDPHPLAAAILQLHEDPPYCDALAAAAYQVFLEKCSEQVIGAKVGEVIATMLA